MGNLGGWCEVVAVAWGEGIRLSPLADLGLYDRLRDVMKESRSTPTPTTTLTPPIPIPQALLCVRRKRRNRRSKEPGHR